MSDSELTFFIIFLSIQIAIPLWRLIWIYGINRGDIDHLSDSFYFFTWTMKLKCTLGSVETSVIERQSGKLVVRQPLKGALPLKQYLFLYQHPSSTIQYAKFVQKKFDLDKLDYGLYFHTIANINDRGERIQVKENVDFCKEKVKWFGRYHWIPS
ncbi:MAG: HTTM domain-containing protein [Chlamydiota bacterium]|nr:HTTM domain-containing protein [Chlamydiota bacterium]